MYVLVLLAVSLPAMAQRNVITGVVYDESGLPLTGASVIVEGTNRGVTTDSYGKYRIEAAPEEALIFNFLGYRSQKFKVGASTCLLYTSSPTAMDKEFYPMLYLELT